MTSTEKPAESFKSLFGQRLEPYLALSKSAKGAACAQLIRDVLAAPGVMVFGELLDMPNVVEVGSQGHSFFFNHVTGLSWQYDKKLIHEWMTHSMTNS